MSHYTYKSPYQELAWKVYLREQIRDQLERQKLLSPGASAREMIAVITREFGVVSKLEVFDGHSSAWSSVLGSKPNNDDVRPAPEKLERLCLAVKGRLKKRESRATIEGMVGLLRKDFEANGPRAMPVVELLIPPAIDALVIEHRISLEGEYPREKGKTESPKTHVQVVRARREELRDGQRPPGRSRFFYMTWDAALKIQKELQKATPPEKVLALQGWSMTTSPTYCLIRRGKRRATRATSSGKTLDQVHEAEGSSAALDSLGRQLENCEIIGIRRTTATESFKRLFDELQQHDLVRRHHKVCEVSSMPTLIELMKSAIMPDHWIVVGGPSTYWAAQSAEVEILHSTERDARHIPDTDRDAHCVIVTTQRYLDPIDPEGRRAAQYLHRVGASLKATFNITALRERSEFRERLSKSIVDRYRKIADEPLYMDKDDVKLFISTGMDLRVSDPCLFVPIEEYRPNVGLPNPKAPFGSALPGSRGLSEKTREPRPDSPRP